MTNKKGKRWLCVDCGSDTSKLREHYFVKDEVWFGEAGMGKVGMLCVADLEKRIGRRLQKNDFPRVHINDPKKYEMSELLRSRIS